MNATRKSEMALKSQRANIDAGKCRYGGDHPAPEPGRSTCERCRAKREQAKLIRMADQQSVRAYRCGTCGGEGHSRVTCQGASR
jgi:hypothetical protein